MAKFVRRIVVENERVKAAYDGDIETADIPASGVTPGTYPSANITVGVDGRVTAATSGAGTAPDELVLTFGWNNASPRLIGVVPAGRTAARVRLAFTTAFLDIGSTVTVGTALSPSAYMAAGQNEPVTVGDYETVPLAPAAADTQVFLSITPGFSESSGRGIAVVEYEPTSGG